MHRKKHMIRMNRESSSVTPHMVYSPSEQVIAAQKRGGGPVDQMQGQHQNVYSSSSPPCDTHANRETYAFTAIRPAPSMPQK